MLSIVRGGPRGMLLRGDREGLDRALESAFQVVRHTFESALDSAGEGQTIVALHGREDDGNREYRVVASPSDDVLAALANDPARAMESVRLLPRILFFRVFGESDQIVAQMENDLSNGGIQGATVRRGRLRSLLGSQRKNDIAVCFTRSPLNGPVTMADLLDDVLLVTGVFFHDLYSFLRARALWFFSEGLDNRSWNEMEIRVYDSWGSYMDHAERFRTVLDGLEIGMILGEGWGKDYAHILLPVRVYRFRLFTFLSAEQVKGLLVGLEYSADGERLADFDLYRGKEKVSWGDLKNREKGGRGALGEASRERLFSRLRENDRKRLVELEERALSRREGR